MWATGAAVGLMSLAEVLHDDFLFACVLMLPLPILVFSILSIDLVHRVMLEFEYKILSVFQIIMLIAAVNILWEPSDYLLDLLWAFAAGVEWVLPNGSFGWIFSAALIPPPWIDHSATLIVSNFASMSSWPCPFNSLGSSAWRWGLLAHATHCAVVCSPAVHSNGKTQHDLQLVDGRSVRASALRR